jgi:hypothetical protein
MHRLLAEYHRKLATEALLDVVQQYHADLAQRLADEAALVPRRTAIVERLHERERQRAGDGDADKGHAATLAAAGCGFSKRVSPCRQRPRSSGLPRRPVWGAARNNPGFGDLWNHDRPKILSASDVGGFDAHWRRGCLCDVRT